MVKYFSSYKGKMEIFNIILDALTVGIECDFDSTDLLIVECDGEEWTLKCYKREYDTALESLLRWLEKKELYEECTKVLELIKKTQN